MENDSGVFGERSRVVTNRKSDPMVHLHLHLRRCRRGAPGKYRTSSSSHVTGLTEIQQKPDNYYYYYYSQIGSQTVPQAQDLGSKNTCHSTPHYWDLAVEMTGSSFNIPEG